jgi:Transposase DDE domain group 1
MTAFADHGADGNGEPLAIVLRAGNAGSNTAADHIQAAGLAVAQLPRSLRGRVLISADSGGGTHDFLRWLTTRPRPLRYSIGMTITDDMQDAILKVPPGSWTPAYDDDGQVRDGAWVADVTGLLDLSSWPAGMRVIVRRERPHPGAQLRFTDVDGHRFTAFATDAKKGQLADLELRHRRRARCEDRKDPERQGHRPSQPAAEGLRAEPAVVRDRRPGLRAAGLDPAARPNRHGPTLGTQTAPPAHLRRRRPPRPRRPPPAATAGRTMALDWRDRSGRHPPAIPPIRLTSPNRHDDQERKHQGRGTPPTRRDSRTPSHGRRPKIDPSRTPQTRTATSRNFEVKRNANSGPLLGACPYW